MRNPWDPSPDEIREWAYTPDAAPPCADWELALAWARHEKAMLECASDPACPNRAFMLGVLYFIVGHAVHNPSASRERTTIEAFVARGDDYHGHPDIALWQERSRALLRDPSTFEYAAWCGGGLANDRADGGDGSTAGERR